MLGRRSISSRPRTETANAALEAGVHEGVVQLDDSSVRFAHPLLASICYERAPIWKRQAVHRRLADVVPDGRAPVGWPFDRTGGVLSGAEPPIGRSAIWYAIQSLLLWVTALVPVFPTDGHLIALTRWRDILEALVSER